jgi:GT2 family glycosyltransferase
VSDFDPILAIMNPRQIPECISAFKKLDVRTCMSREMWREFPFGCFGTGSRGYSSDFHLSRRLRDAGVPMVAARDGYVTHVKEQWNKLDRGEGRQLLVGVEPADVVVDE